MSILNLEKITDAVRRYDDKAAELQREVDELIEKSKQAEEHYRKLIFSDVSDGGSTVSSEDIAVAKREADLLADESRRAQETLKDRLQALKIVRQKKVEEILKELRNDANEQIKQLRQEIETKFEESRMLRAEILLLLKQAHEFRKQAQQIKSEFRSVACSAGFESMGELLNVQDTIPTGNYYDASKKIVSDKAELEKAFLRGELEPWAENLLLSREKADTNHNSSLSLRSISTANKQRDSKPRAGLMGSILKRT